MISPALPFVECDQVHAGLAVLDIPTAIEFYVGKLRFRQAFTWGDPPTFAGVNLGDVQIFWHAIPFLKGCLQRIEEERMLQALTGKPRPAGKSKGKSRKASR